MASEFSTVFFFVLWQTQTRTKKSFDILSTRKTFFKRSVFLSSYGWRLMTGKYKHSFVENSFLHCVLDCLKSWRHHCLVSMTLINSIVGNSWMRARKYFKFHIRCISPPTQAPVQTQFLTVIMRNCVRGSFCVLFIASHIAYNMKNSHEYLFDRVLHCCLGWFIRFLDVHAWFFLNPM